jgi:hypothetical protein
VRAVSLFSFFLIQLIRWVSLNSSPAIMPLAALYFWVDFLKGRSPSKMGLIAPFLATIQPFSKARAFLLS